MTVRIRAIVIIIVTNLVIILFSVFTGIGFTRKNIEKSIETDMMVVADIADHFISSEIEVLKLKAFGAASGFTQADSARRPAILEEQSRRYSEFIGMAIIDGGGNIIHSTGKLPHTKDLLTDKNIKRAFEGETVISTTLPAADGVVFSVAAPLPDRSGHILALTLPGLYFSQALSTFVIWNTGHIFIDDSDGSIIANIRPEWVQNRLNFIRLSQTNKMDDGIASVIKKMISGEMGIGRFSIDGIPRICAYRQVAGSREGWCLGVIAPLPESPTRNIITGLLVVGIVAIFLSIMAAAAASGFIEKPFKLAAALKEEAEANSRSKTQFLATMSHEMRTPLNAVIGLSELILDGKIDGEDRENMEKVYTAGGALLGIVNDILDISKIESGKFELNPIVYDVPSLINDAVTLNSMRINEKQIQFRFFIDESFPSKLYGDDLRIKQIFNNLLSNAFKYTRAGIVEWHILWEKTGNEIWLTSKVIDSGIGIKPEDISKLFKNYTQVDTHSHRKLEGTGLGLALTRRLVEMMEGTISVESEYGKGSVFSFRIKQGYVTDSPIGPEMAAGLRSFRFFAQKQDRYSKFIRIRLPYARVLVVDDIAPNLAVIKGIMKPYGMQVDCVTSGKEAIKLIREGVKYNAIFMDHMMPELDGIETVRIIRSDINSEYARTVPIVALTANAIRGNEEMFLQSGFQAFLSKPVDIIKMDAVIRQWVRNKDLEPPLKDPAEEDWPLNKSIVEEKKVDGIEGADLEKANELFGGDTESLTAVLRIFSDQVPAVLDRVRVFSAEKLADYIIDIHGIKGICRNIYAEAAGSMAESLEFAGKAGDTAFIEKNNQSLVDIVDTLIVSVNKWLESA